MSSRYEIQLPKSTIEKNPFKEKIKYPNRKTVFDVAVELNCINWDASTKTLTYWTGLTERQIYSIKDKEKVELALALLFAVGIGATHDQIKKIVWVVLGYDLSSPALFDYDYSLTIACSIKETSVGERAECLRKELIKRNVGDRCLKV